MQNGGGLSFSPDRALEEPGPQVEHDLLRTGTVDGLASWLREECSRDRNGPGLLMEGLRIRPLLDVVSHYPGNWVKCHMLGRVAASPWRASA